MPFFRHLSHPYSLYISKGFMLRLYTSIITGKNKIRIKNKRDDYLVRKEKLLPKRGFDYYNYKPS